MFFFLGFQNSVCLPHLLTSQYSTLRYSIAHMANGFGTEQSSSTYSRAESTLTKMQSKNLLHPEHRHISSYYKTY